MHHLHDHVDDEVAGAGAPAPVRGAGGAVYLETFGCQMNELDSELVRGSLSALGYRFTDQPESADVILYNTCSVREHAEQKVWSRVGLMGRRKRKGERFVLGVIGCMAEREGVSMMRRFPQIDLLCGPGELDRLPLLIDNALKTGAVHAADLQAQRVALQGNNHRRSSTLSAASDNLEMLDLSRAFDPDRASGGAGGRSAYVRITRGCNKFCTYCVVPYTRGAEVHRAPDAIVDECRRLADAGVIEITLLGQTVNHYSYTHGAAMSADGLELPQIGGKFEPRRDDAGRANGRATTSFAELLHRIHDEVPAIRRLRFVTSYPRDFTDEALAVMRDCTRICRYLHAPAQSGSNRILKLMNRGYTVEQYLEFIDRARAIVPDVCIGGDIIVGFPTETDDDFEMTKTLMRRVRFKNNFIFKYSPRPLTVAMDRFEDDVPEQEKRRRNNELLALQAQISAEVHAQWIGRTVEVFVENVRQRGPRFSDAPAAGSGAAASASRVQVRWNGRTLHGLAAADEPSASDRPFLQASGRTSGDLITVFDLSGSEAGDGLPGQIVQVRVDEAGPLLLRGEMVRNGVEARLRAQPVVA